MRDLSGGRFRGGEKPGQGRQLQAAMIGPVRRNPSTVVVLAGQAPDTMLAAVGGR